MTTPVEQLAFRPTGAPGPPPLNQVTLGDFASRIVNVKDYGAYGDGGSGNHIDTAAIREAISAAFGIAAFVGGNSATVSNTLVVSAVNYGKIPIGAEICSTQRASVSAGDPLYPSQGSITGTTLTLTAPPDGVIVIGQSVFGTNVLPNTVITGGSNLSWTVNNNHTTPTGSVDMFLTGFSPAWKIVAGPSNGGTGTYTISNSSSPSGMAIANGTLIFSSNGQGGNFKNRPLWFPSGNYLIDQPLILINILGGLIYGTNSQIFSQVTGTEGNPISSEIPSATPIFMLDGVGYVEFRSLSLTAQVVQQVALATNASTTAPSAVLNFPDTTGVLAGMAAYGVSNPSSFTATGSIVKSVTSTTVTMSGPVASGGSGGVAANDSIVFVSTTMGIYAYQSGIAGYTGGLSMYGVGCNHMGTGFLGGSGPGNCDNMIFYDCQFNNCALAGIRTNSANALNWNVYGGGGSGCGTASTYDPITKVVSGNMGAFISVPTGSISVISSFSCTGNVWDVINGGAQGMTIVGGRCEGGGIKAYVATFTASITGGLMTVTAITAGRLMIGSIIAGPGVGNGVAVVSFGTGAGGTGTYNLSGSSSVPGGTILTSTGLATAQSIASCSGGSTTVINTIFGGGIPGLAGDEGCRALDLTFTGNMNLLGYIYAQNNQTGNGIFCHLGNNGILIADNLQFGNWAVNGLLKGGGNARVYIRNVDVSLGQSASFFTNFTGKIMEYTANPELTVATLPTPNARWDRAVLTVGDSNLAWSAANIAATIAGHGGGTHAVPLRCPDGTGWVIAG